MLVSHCTHWIKITMLYGNDNFHIIISLVNQFGYPYFHHNFAEYGRFRSEIARKQTAFIRNIGHSNTVPYFYYIRPYTDCTVRPELDYVRQVHQYLIMFE